MEYTFTVPELIQELEHWADTRDKINQRKPDRPRGPLSSTPLREAAARLREQR
jgi:hypothetical protein